MSNGQIYIGFTKDLKKRVSEHKSGKVFSTKKYLPIKLIYYEAYLSEKDAHRREKMLKQRGSSKAFLRKRIDDSLKGFQRLG